MARDRSRQHLFPQFGLPEWSVRAVIVAALLGLRQIADALDVS